MPVQYDIFIRPTIYLVAIIFFWRTVQKKGPTHQRLLWIMSVLFVASVALSLYEVSASDDQVIPVGNRQIPYMVVRALLENVGLFAIVASLLLLLTGKLKTAQRRVDQLAQIASSSADAIVGFDETGTITSWNRGAELVFGYFADEILGQKVERLVAPEYVAKLEAATQRCRNEGFVRGLNCSLMGKGRKVTLTEVTLSVIRDDVGEPIGTSLFVRDITEQKEMEKEFLEASKMAAMGTMAAGVAKEFGNLLTVISARAQLGYAAEALDETHEEFEAISSCADRAKSVVNNLLAYARRQRPKNSMGNLADAADAALAVLERELARSKVVVRRRYEPVPPTAFDHEQILQAFVNVIMNSLNAMHEKGGTIDIGISKKQEYVEVTVRDDGPGISQDLMGRLFEPFSNGSETPTESSANTGLGLFVCRQIVKFHNGNISVESHKGEGTTIRLYLPIVSPSEPVRDDADTKVVGSSKCKVAVVDKDVMIRDLMAQALKRREMNAETFQDAESAREAGVEERFDVVFVDLSIRAGEQTRYVETLKDNPDQIIVGMISEPVEPDELREIEEGLFDTLRKPFGLDEINNVCDRIKPAKMDPGEIVKTSAA